MKETQEAVEIILDELQATFRHSAYPEWLVRLKIGEFHLNKKGNILYAEISEYWSEISGDPQVLSVLWRPLGLLKKQVQAIEEVKEIVSEVGIKRWLE